MSQASLFDWSAPTPTLRYDDIEVRAATVQARVSRAVAACLRRCEVPRGAIAQAMSEKLGAPVSVNMLNAYASAARDAHSISLARFVALLHATGDRRLLEFIAEPCGWAVIERRNLKYLELEALRQRQAELRRQMRPRRAR